MAQAQEIPPEEATAREHLANERTLLAWARIGTAMISIGIVLKPASLYWGKEGAGTGFLSVVLAALGSLTLALGGHQFRRTRRQILDGRVPSASRVYLALAAGGLLVGGVFIVYVLFFS